MTEVLKTLFLTTPGTSLHLEGDTVRIHHPEKPGRNVLPLVRIDQFVVWRGVEVSNELMHRCAKDSRGITWLSRNGRFLHRTTGPQNGNPVVRLEQVRAHDDESRRLELAKTFLASKIQNYRQLLLRTARDAADERKEKLREIAQRHADSLETLSGSSSVSEVLGVEGKAGQDYFQEGMPKLAPGVFPGRTRRPPKDTFNCLLSFGYGMLQVAVEGALEQVGLDPYIGYLHGVRSGQPSLALDLMEEFRAMLVDRLVATLYNRGQVKSAHTESLPSGEVRLTDEGRTMFLEQWSKARERSWRHSELKRDVPAATLPLIQARFLARHLRGDQPSYTPWIAS
ncbi:CRISPR-associated endonuclease Cas1 [Actinopolyspora saharensis]|uniref:CRISPR-associated endonuclease Cas1 n=1 Tax=Actinopolyspora saharensis TaxID=995062 RepID=A0A1H1DN21_9ACTN|nr:CRISPR-associated endonuclease Cas1 [Actinopolyspora saharensis]SDQ77618.1 CRISPR-associated protein, Cas1 family [Actinopolyspora saharensis]